MDVKRTGIVVRPNNSRVVFRPFELTSEDRVLKIIARIMALSEAAVEALLDEVMLQFKGRHQRIRDFFLLRFHQVKQFLLTDLDVSVNRQILIGSYFTHEYALESAALFNPSMIWHPDQSGLAEGSRRFILSLRATGEGHISSITFRSGVVDANNNIRIDEPTRYVTAPEAVPDARYDKALFRHKLFELGLANRFTDRVLEKLTDQFTLDQLDEQLQLFKRQHQHQAEQLEHKPTIQGMLALAKSNYEIQYTPEHHLSERIVFPSSPTERNAIEDARFVQFHDDDGSTHYYATYTAYDGKVILPQLLQTTITFEMLMAPSFSTMPPLIFFCGFGRVWRLTIATCSTTTRFVLALMESTRPVFPASRPAITFT